MGTMETTEPMETIAQSLTPRQKARLHEVADLMLQIFRTLERMRFLEPEWIQPGPHDLTKLMPLYRSLNLDPTIIYLYHILPYIDRVMPQRPSFFDGGTFVDFRDEIDVERGRNPMFVSKPAEMLRPWMTPLSATGNLTSFLVYDAKRHVVGIFNPQDGGSSDRNIRGEWVYNATGEDGKERYFKWWDGVAEECSAEEFEEIYNRPRDDEEDEEEYESGEDESEDGEEEEEEEEEEERNWWDEMDARPAPKVLRDVIRWYHELVELPGTGESDWGRWPKDIVKPLYQKHGWPGEDFDGDAFLVDKVRAEAAQEAQSRADRPFDDLNRLRHQLRWHEEEEVSAMAKLQEKLAAATTVDEEWVVRWEIFRAEHIARALRQNLARAEQSISMHERLRPEDLPLWELKHVHMELLSEKRRRATWGQEVPGTGLGRYSAAKIQEGIRATEKMIAILEKAYAASLADAERLCPNRSPFPLVGGEETCGWDRRPRVAELTQNIEDVEQENEERRRWMALLPDGAGEARKLAQTLIDRDADYVELAKEQRRKCLVAIEESAKQTQADSGGRN